MINSGPSSVPEKGILLTLVIFLKLLKCIDETIIRALMKKTEEIYSNRKLSPILILVPTYNEIENIEKFIRYFYEHLNYDLLILW